MSEMLERMAREICRVTCPLVTQRKPCQSSCQADGDILRRAISQARAGAAALREPTKAMIDAYMRALEQPLPEGDKRYPYYRAKAIKRYQAMIDEVLR